MEKRKTEKPGRREFIAKSAAAFAGISILPGHVVSGFGHTVPSDRLNIACVGIGGMGKSNLANIKNDNIVALCDVDWGEASTKVFRQYPKARQYRDYRVMLDKQKDI
ncbi:MAG TPA: gfo/Idh/MocA family oxidoreductase, partial [Bacteroidales bacterium]|nr:gfo/Idh/MocA family oxidoreductase [Bacteroidales bacterium]